MSAKIFGITSNDIIPQPDFEATQNENGGWKATQSFVIKKGGIDDTAIREMFSGGKALTELDANADQYFSFLFLTGIPSVTTMGGGFTRISCEFSGITSGSSPQQDEEGTLPTYSLRGTLKDAPLNEHNKWKALGDADKYNLGLLLSGQAVTNSSYADVGYYDSDGFYQTYTNPDTGLPHTFTGDALEFAKRIAQGKTTYRCSTFEWTKRWESKQPLTSAQLNSLSHITTPPGSPPTPNGDRNWLLVNVASEQYGSGEYRYQHDLVFELSDRGGHDSFLQST